jgi:murein DD-endopeptidase MepM/ murein hydrolase activator NlpD
MNSRNSSNLNPTKTVSLSKSRFTDMLIEINALGKSRFDRWIFCSGMLFNSPDKWWGDHGRRDYPHEGIDFCLYGDHSQRIRRIDEKTRIPVMHDGVVKAMFNDYLGKAVIIEHENGRFLSIYAHTNPQTGLQIGLSVKEGDIIATLADTSKSKSGIIPHLHFSLGIPSRHFSYDRFEWRTIRTPEMITLLDPKQVIDWPFQALALGNTACRDL